MLDIVLFVIFPYAAVLLAVGGSLYRYLTNQFSYSSMSSQFLENENLFWGSTLWHYGVLPTLLIHLAGFTVPKLMVLLHGTPTLLYISELLGKMFGLIAFAGIIVLIVRRVKRSKIAGRVLTALARERIAEEAQKRGADYLFMIDDDMLAGPDIFERLYRHNVDIVAGLAFNRYMPHKPVLYEVKTGYDNVEKKEYFMNFPIIDYPRDTLVQCDAVGFGAVLIKMSVFDKVPKPWFMTMSGAGEDLAFCWKAGKAGVKIYMDTATKMGHLGEPEIISEETFDSEVNKKMITRLRNPKAPDDNFRPSAPPLRSAMGSPG